ncbi:hypothetical protein AP75_01905 [Kaistella haifensis DSM 19056]|uniref:Uncharacterized protein n=1 Tax=Kaistella haifensis DSM 19056 TaxID=1450526 RepID=A0A246BC67_9FLAO|nr:hypothetical protein [Kaistella haifensis]OWK99265.1 hypothetical protein AP75_01905 [Kaistella haifensis DSM 19056]
MKHTDLAQDYFERHSRSNECHITSDGRVFHTSGHAISFAQENNLQDQTIESYTRDQAEKIATVPVEPVGPTEEEIIAKTEELKNLDIDAAEYPVLKTFIKFFDIKCEDQKAATLKTALTEYKNNLAQ